MLLYQYVPYSCETGLTMTDLIVQAGQTWRFHTDSATMDLNWTISKPAQSRRLWISVGDGRHDNIMCCAMVRLMGHAPVCAFHVRLGYHWNYCASFPLTIASWEKHWHTTHGNMDMRDWSCSCLEKKTRKWQIENGILHYEIHIANIMENMYFLTPCTLPFTRS